MRWPQILMIILLGANLGMNLIKDGEPKEGKYNFAATLLATVIEVAILRAGGFWRN